MSLCGLALMRVGRGDEARSLLLRAVEAEPAELGFRLNLAEYYERTQQFEAAARELRVIVLREPRFKAAWARLIGSSQRARNWAVLEADALAWLQAAPGEDVALNAVAEARYARGDVAGARDAYHMRVQNNPQSAEAQCSYGLCCLALGDFDAAGAALDAAERLDAHDAEMLAGKARMLTYLGRFAEAEAYCRRCLAVDPENVEALSSLSQLTGGRLADAERATLELLVGRATLAPDWRISAAFTLARALDVEADADAAFAAYAQANELCLQRARAEGLSYDHVQSEAHARAIIARSERPDAARESMDATPMPIFIVGMPRSGTTLVESVLSAHSQVTGKSELLAMRATLASWLRTPEANAAQWEVWSRAYLGAAQLAGGTAYFTDKQPMNYEAVGLIARLFPRSPIVHVRRDPLETGFSIYRQSLSKFMNFSNRLEDIGHMYGQCARLMVHWERELPGRVITLQYEDFVADFDNAAPKLLRACGLEWEEACRSFQDAPRAIATFSTVQVRQPLAVRSGAAVRYAEHLEPLRAELERQGVDLKTGAWMGA
jgi:tetratricopeptide (TPR) repeat protein